jgi:hypothetical protein
MAAINFSAFDINAFKDISKDDCVTMARISEAADRFEDMIKWMYLRVKKFDDAMTADERNLMSVAYKNVIGQRRTAWRQFQYDLDQSPPENKPAIQEYINQVSEEILEISQNVLALLEDTLIHKGEQSEEQVFFLKMAGDYYRYLTESHPKDEYKEKCKDFYTEAFAIAKDQLQATHPIRLGLALNFSVCYYEILKQPDMACELAKTAFDDAISKLDYLEETDYRDATLIMQLLRDNLTLWTSANEKESGDDDLAVQDIEDDAE